MPDHEKNPLVSQLPAWLRDASIRKTFVDTLVITNNIRLAAAAIGKSYSNVASTVYSHGGKAQFKRLLGIDVSEGAVSTVRANAIAEIMAALSSSVKPNVPGLFVNRGAGLVKRGRKDPGRLEPLVQLVFTKPGTQHDPIAFDSMLVTRVTRDLHDKDSLLYKAARAAGVGRVDIVTHPVAKKGISKPTATSVVI
ncbi:MAG: hypothetical protein AAB573_02440 [Patescibacteria group bacterium]